jgi:cell wall-active antibiotic response 4TMS protein YvqF
MNPRAASMVGVIRGPVMLIALGVLLAIDHAGRTSFARTWPVLLILFGALTLLERAGDRRPSITQKQP